MLRRVFGIVVFALFLVSPFLVSPSSAVEIGAVLRKIDVEKQVAFVFANGQERTIKIAADTKVKDEKGETLSDGLSAKELKEGTTLTISVDFNGKAPTIAAIRLGGKLATNTKPNGSDTPSVGKASVGKVSVGKPSLGFKPLTEMTVEDRYKGEDGGLYGAGQNDPPELLKAAATKVSENIVPRDADGVPTANGTIGLVSISMSNATQEYARFKQIADADNAKSPLVNIVDCAQGGQTMARWADPKAACWVEADHRLKSAGVSLNQVQVAWIKLANAGPNGELYEHGKQLDQDTRTVLSNITSHFPNLRIVYLGSRIYGGYADGRLNPEPYAYEGAFVCRWLIQSQMKGDAELNYDPDRGQVKSPLLLWGPYLWADGMTPRTADKLVWERDDLVTDGTHPSNSGRQKVAEQLLTFFKTDANARTWYVKK